MPKINHRRKNPTNGTRSGGGCTSRSWTGPSRRKPWQRIAWKVFRACTRNFIKKEKFSKLPQKMTRMYYSEPGFVAPNFGKGSEGE